MKINKLAISILSIFLAGELFAKKSYQKKAPCAGLGKVSKSTGRIKIKTTNGYFKPSNRCKFVNPYSRS